MKVILVLALFTLGFIWAAIAHERDIYNSCIRYGHSASAMWTGKIKCEEYSNAKQN